MALASTNSVTTSRNIIDGISGFFTSIGRWLVALAEADQRLKQLERLSSLSDEALAARGLQRQDIALHVFRNKLYL